MGVASCILAVGGAVPSARPGVGVVAVQARSRRGLGGRLLTGLAEGAAPADLVRRAAHAAEDADRQSAALLVVSGEPASEEDDGVRTDLRVDDSGDPVAQLRMLRNLQRAYDDRDYETLALFAPVGARDLYAALAATRRGDRTAARTALEAVRTRPGWSTWLAAMAGDARLSGVSRLLG